MSKLRPASVLNVVTSTIPSGAAVPTTGVDLQNYVLGAVEFPAIFTGTGITFQVSQDNATWVDVYNITITKQTGKVVPVGATYRTLDFMGRYLLIKSSGSESQDSAVKLYLLPR